MVVADQAPPLMSKLTIDSIDPPQMSDKLSRAHGPLVWEVRARLQAAANPACSLNTNVGSTAPRSCLAPNGAATILFSKWAGNRAEVVVAKEAVHVATHNALGGLFQVRHDCRLGRLLGHDSAAALSGPSEVA